MASNGTVWTGTIQPLKEVPNVVLSTRLDLTGGEKGTLALSTTHISFSSPSSTAQVRPRISALILILSCPHPHIARLALGIHSRRRLSW